MNINDFRYMRRGKQVSCLSAEDLTFLKPISQRGNGSDSALLLLHGFSSSPAVYRYLIPEIKKPYDAIICPILAGHANSIEAFSKTTAQDWLKTAYQACDSLTKEYKKVDVLGLSLGGLLACELSKQFTLNHLFLLAPALKIRMNNSAMLKLARVAKCIGFQYLRNAAGNLLSNESAEISYRKLPISVIIEMLQLVQDYQWVAPTCPTDVFLGRYDDVVSSIDVEQIFKSLPNATIHWLNNSAHVLPLDNDRAEIIKCVNHIK